MIAFTKEWIENKIKNLDNLNFTMKMFPIFIHCTKTIDCNNFSTKIYFIYEEILPIDYTKTKTQFSNRNGLW